MYNIIRFKNNKKEVVPTSWMLSENVVAFPKSKKTYEQYVKDTKTSKNIITKWPSHNVEVIASKIVTYEQAQNNIEPTQIATRGSRFINQQEGNKRKQLSYLQYGYDDFKSEAKKLKIHTSEKCDIENWDEFQSKACSTQEVLKKNTNTKNITVLSIEKLQNEVEEHQNQYIENDGQSKEEQFVENAQDDSNEDEFMEEEYLEIDQLSSCEAQIKHKDANDVEQGSALNIEAFKENVNAQAKCNCSIQKCLEEIRNMKAHFDQRLDVLERKNAGSKDFVFEKVSSPERLNELEQALNNNEYKRDMINWLKSLGSVGKHHKLIYSRISTILNNLFDEDFIKFIRYGESSNSNGFVYALILYPNIMSLITAAMSIEQEEGGRKSIIYPQSGEIKKGIQNHFRHHVK